MSDDVQANEKAGVTPGIPELPGVRMHLHTPASPGVGVVVSNERCTASSKAASFVRHVVLDVSRTALAGAFRSGQSFGVIPPGIDAKGRPHQLRLYSIASPTRGEDGRGLHLATTVKRTIEELPESHKLYLGIASNYICDLQVGDEVKVTGPNGKRFVLPADPDRHDYLFLATGTGIAPFRGMVLELLARNSDSRVTLVMGSPYSSDLIYHQELLALEARHPRFRYLPAISRERQADGSPPMYVHDHLDRSRDVLIPMLESGRTLIYVCGIAGMELGLLQKLVGCLTGKALEQYLEADAKTLADVGGWTRRMLHKQVKPTRRVFLEVY